MQITHLNFPGRMLEIFTGFWPKSASEPKTDFLNLLHDSVKQPEFLAYLSRMSVNKDGTFTMEDCDSNTYPVLIQIQNIYNISNYICIYKIYRISPQNTTLEVHKQNITCSIYLPSISLHMQWLVKFHSVLEKMLEMADKNLGHFSSAVNTLKLLCEHWEENKLA